MFSRKNVNLEICIKYIKLAAHSINEKVDFVDLAIMTELPEQSNDKPTNETRGCELNYIENDTPMSEVFRRVQSF